MDYIIHGVAKRWTRLSVFHSEWERGFIHSDHGMYTENCFWRIVV